VPDTGRVHPTHTKRPHGDGFRVRASRGIKKNGDGEKPGIAVGVGGKERVDGSPNKDV
jgi:hypothetical protein